MSRAFRDFALIGKVIALRLLNLITKTPPKPFNTRQLLSLLNSRSKIYVFNQIYQPPASHSARVMFA